MYESDITKVCGALFDKRPNENLSIILNYCGNTRINAGEIPSGLSPAEVRGHAARMFTKVWREMERDLGYEQD